MRSGDLSVIGNNGLRADTLYRQERFELSAFAAVKWRPVPRLGVAADLRWELYGDRTTPVIPALFADYVLSKRGSVVVRASAARNYRYPTLNDLYFRPGGNKNPQTRTGLDVRRGLETTLKGDARSLRASATVFDSRIDDWILWIGSPKLGIYTPINIRRVHSYGVETKLSAEAETSGGWRLLLDGNFAWTRSINRGDPVPARPTNRSANSSSTFRLFGSPHGARRVAAVGADLQMELVQRTLHHVEQRSRRLGPRETLLHERPLARKKGLDCKWASFSLKGCIHNLLNEEYESVLSRPMPRLNVSFFHRHNPQIRQTMTLREQLLELTEPKYMKFTSALMPGVKTCWAYACPYCAASPKRSPPETGAHIWPKPRISTSKSGCCRGLVIGYARCEPAEKLAHVARFVPKIDNWAVCDCFCWRLRAAERQPMWEFIQPLFSRAGRIRHAFRRSHGVGQFRR